MNLFKSVLKKTLEISASAVLSALIGTAIASAAASTSNPHARHWLKLKASNSAERSAIANEGVALEAFADDYVIAIGNERQRDLFAKQGLLEATYELNNRNFDFPENDSRFHNYERMLKDLQELAQANPDLVTLDSIGKSVEGRDLWHLRIGYGGQPNAKPAVVYMGGHHAREHVSVEIPLLFAHYLIDQYKAGNATVVNLVRGRDIHIIPMVNPDGAEYDISTGDYKFWRKNRAQNDGGEFGVDLNRNYSFKWGTGGSSANPADETYKGPQPFSEPETQAIKAFIEKQNNLTMLLTLHTYSELVLYPWGNTVQPISVARDLKVYEKMATTMAGWNGYKPEQTSSLYVASGDTTDWAYGEHRIFSFTFELDPSNQFGGGFYPGQAVIDPVFQKNLKPMLYMMDLADNPYRALDTTAAQYGLANSGNWLQ